MNILFITITRIENFEQKNIYIDLVNELIKHNINVFCISGNEKKYNQKTELINNDNLHHLKLEIGDITKVNFIKKGINTLTVQNKYISAIKKYFSDVKFDLVLYATPPITFGKVVKYVKKRDNANSYLMLKDIFPDNAVDLGIFSNKSIFYKIFRKKEIEMYKLSDRIGCMSPQNIKYLLDHNQYIDENSVELFPNAINPLPFDMVKNYKNSSFDFKKKNNIPTNKKILLYGGNLGKPQGIEFIKKCILENEKEEYVILIIGNGTEYNNVNNFIETNNIKNTILFKEVNTKEYLNFLGIADAGLIFLDNRFTIPNFPSRLLSYLEFSLPVIACTDKNTDLGKIIEENNFGYWCESDDPREFISNINILFSEDNYIKCTENSRKFLENNYNIKEVAKKLIF